MYHKEFTVLLIDDLNSTTCTYSINLEALLMTF
ncbi:hypothetical protein JL09_g6198 [Pichia kudriavzevii]|uniref:Uncharacterized protein n=1 Tax=Pichia kudriavzevii TaxID=4909 RepID=A0A099NPC6_PICKU|nr:hypothetical protein JL09_g6198 [Pichia kudriavzevii]